MPKSIVATDARHLTVDYGAAPRRGGCFELLTQYTSFIQLPRLIDISQPLTVAQTLPEARIKVRTRTLVVAAADPAEQPPSVLPCRPDIKDHRLQHRFSYDHGSTFDPTNAPMTTTVEQALASYRRIEQRRRQPISGQEQGFWARYSDGATIRDKLAWVIWTPAPCAVTPPASSRLASTASSSCTTRPCTRSASSGAGPAIASGDEG